MYKLKLKSYSHPHGFIIQVSLNWKYTYIEMKCYVELTIDWK